MVSLVSLWLPVLLAAVLVFAASSLIHMVLGYHRADFRKVPEEDQVMEPLGRFSIPPGDYVMPHAASPAEMKSPGFVEKSKRGPVAFLTALPAGIPSMGPRLAQWFLTCVLVGLFAGYVAGRALGPGAPYLSVFRLAGTTAFAGYGLALLQESIWYGRAWSTTLKNVFDALVYALLTAGAFGWLWPS